jgi:hypothetical protein
LETGASGLTSITLSLADQFARILCAQLTKVIPAGEWNCSHRIGSGREAVDVCGWINGRTIYVEVELRRDEPLTNVVKLWRAIEDHGHTHEVILVHAFSGHYPPTNSRRTHAEFIGRHMQRACGAAYIPIYFPFRPKKGAVVVGDYRRRAALSLAASISKTLDNVFDIERHSNGSAEKN